MCRATVVEARGGGALCADAASSRQRGGWGPDGPHNHDSGDCNSESVHQGGHPGVEQGEVQGFTDAVEGQAVI